MRPDSHKLFRNKGEKMQFLKHLISWADLHHENVIVNEKPEKRDEDELNGVYALPNQLHPIDETDMRVHLIFASVHIAYLELGS